jgi:hypothetical protein
MEKDGNEIRRFAHGGETRCAEGEIESPIPCAGCAGEAISRSSVVSDPENNGALAWDKPVHPQNRIGNPTSNIEE